MKNIKFFILTVFMLLAFNISQTFAQLAPPQLQSVSCTYYVSVTNAYEQGGAGGANVSTLGTSFSVVVAPGETKTQVINVRIGDGTVTANVISFGAIISVNGTQVCAPNQSRTVTFTYIASTNTCAVM
jgi:hypothetical protein